MTGQQDQEGDAEDRALLQAHLDGDPLAFEALVRKHSRRMWAVAVRTLHDPDEAADAVQEACLSAYRAAGSYRGDARVTTWLHRIVVNASLDRVRRSAARPTVPLPEVLPADPRDVIGEQETRLVVQAALAGLPDEQREALVLVDLQGLPVEQAAALLGVPTGTVKSRCARGRARLALALAPLAPGPRPDLPQQGNRPAPTAVPPAATPDPLEGGTTP